MKIFNAISRPYLAATNNIDHKVMFVTKLLISEASTVLVLHSLYKALKTGQKGTPDPNG